MAIAAFGVTARAQTTIPPATLPPTLPSGTLVSTTSTTKPAVTTTVPPGASSTTAPQTQIKPPPTTTPEAPGHTIPPLPPATDAPPLPIPEDLAALQAQLEAEARASLIASARVVASNAEKTLVEATIANEIAQTHLIAATREWSARSEEMARARLDMASWATHLYVGAGTPPVMTFAPLDPDVLHARQLRTAYGTSRLGAAKVGIAEAAGHLETADIARVRAADLARLSSVAYTDSRRIRDEAVAQVDAISSGPPAPGISPSGPTVLGQSVLTAAELTGWFRSSYPTGGTATKVPMEEIASHYIEEGKAEGVRGDIAFAQAVLETGAWTSGHAANNNPAGIGAFDSCSPECGYGFPTIQLGVRGQIQLLRIYATPGLKSSDLGHPPDPRLTPEGSGVRGCCPTWVQLTGVWATDRGYAPKVLNMFQRMLLWALAHRNGPRASPA